MKSRDKEENHLVDYGNLLYLDGLSCTTDEIIDEINYVALKSL